MEVELLAWRWVCGVGEGNEAGLYSDDGEHIVLVRTNNDRFYAMDSACPHEGGPLELGDVEDMGTGKLALICPWHQFDFCLEDGHSSTGFQNQVYEVHISEGKVYIQTQSSLSRAPQQASGTLLCERFSLKSLTTTSSEDSLCYWAVKILCTSDAEEKVTLTDQVEKWWTSGKIREVGHGDVPPQPSRQENLKVLQPGRIKRGKGGTLASRIALLHSLANIEQWAIDLSWDIIARFSMVKLKNGRSLPLEFFSDFVRVAGEEAKHYKLLANRIKELGSYFGALPVHNGLWQSASDTASDLLARLAIVHMVHEARGLDVHPQMLARFAAQADQSSVRLLEIIYRDEITHVATGLRWFTYICSEEEKDTLATFHNLVRTYFKGYLKPPFNTEGRKIAGMSEQVSLV
uniref:Si:ch73-314g15.3 n=1 Tax=Callorhinchus milii TaxID=7868 RepID=A0A4W3JRY7_CALMI